MSEVYRNTSQFVYLDVYGGAADSTPTAELTSVNGTTRTLNVVSDTPPTGIDERYHVVLNMADTNNDGDVKVTWTFSIDGSPVTKIDWLTVVTPYLNISEVKKIWPEASDEQAIDIEAAVRHVINAHTGQSFGYSERSITVEGHGESALRLPERLIELTGLSTLTATLNVNRSIIVSDGWYLKKGWTDSVTVLTTSDEYFSGTDVNNYADEGEPGYEKPSHGHIIVAPGVNASPTPWRDDYPFTITGKWGYLTVPQPVKEAAKLLVNDYACSEVAYRDRYLESIKAADWRLQFSSRAWQHTGNVRADQLLSDYVLLDWAVV